MPTSCRQARGAVAAWAVRLGRARPEPSRLVALGHATSPTSRSAAGLAQRWWAGSSAKLVWLSLGFSAALLLWPRGTRGRRAQRARAEPPTPGEHRWPHRIVRGVCAVIAATRQRGHPRGHVDRAAKAPRIGSVRGRDRRAPVSSAIIDAGSPTSPDAASEPQRLAMAIGYRAADSSSHRGGRARFEDEPDEPEQLGLDLEGRSAMAATRPSSC